MRISDWSSDVCSSDLAAGKWVLSDRFLDSSRAYQSAASGLSDADIWELHRFGSAGLLPDRTLVLMLPEEDAEKRAAARDGDAFDRFGARDREFHRKVRPEEHTSELQSLMRNSYAV